MKLHMEDRHLALIQNILAKYDYSFFAFGSRVKATHKRFSDLDLFFCEHIPNKALMQLETELEESDLPFKVDIVNYNNCEADFQKIILNDYACIQTSSLLKILQQNHLGHFTFLPKKLGFNVQEINGITIVNSKLKSTMWNIVYGSPENLIDPTGVITQIKEIFEYRPFAWWIPPSQHNPQLKKILLDNGFIIEATEYAMICEITAELQLEQKTNLFIKPVTSSVLMQDFITILEPYDQDIRAFYEKIPDQYLDLQEKHFIGYANGKAVAIGILFFSNDGCSAAIFGIITRESSRYKGYGTDMMRFLINAAKKKSCKFVTLSASSDFASRIYENLGFRKIGQFECFEYKSC